MCDRRNTSQTEEVVIETIYISIYQVAPYQLSYGLMSPESCQENRLTAFWRHEMWLKAGKEYSSQYGSTPQKAAIPIRFIISYHDYSTDFHIQLV